MRHVDHKTGSRDTNTTNTLVAHTRNDLCIAHYEQLDVPHSHTSNTTHDSKQVRVFRGRLRPSGRIDDRNKLLEVPPGERVVGLAVLVVQEQEEDYVVNDARWRSDHVIDALLASRRPAAK